jgi:hypothetical protein
MDTALQSNRCSINETIEDCVLINNAKLVMSTLVLVSSDISMYFLSMIM